MYRVDNYPERELLVLKRTPRGNVIVLVGSTNALRNYRQGAPYSVGGIAFGADGSMYFTHNSNVSKLTSSGALTALARNVVVENAPGKPAEESRLFGIAVDTQGNAFVADYGNRRVLKIAPNGAISTVARADEPWSPTGLAFKDGNVYILEFGFTPPSTYTPRVRKLSPEGRITVLATVSESNNPRGENRVSSVGDSSSREKNRFRRWLPYVALGVVAGVFVLSVIVWRVRRRRSGPAHPKLSGTA